MAEFFAMGKHGLYVWGSFGMAALLMLVEALLVIRQQRTLLQGMSRMIRMNSEVER